MPGASCGGKCLYHKDFRLPPKVIFVMRGARGVFAFFQKLVEFAAESRKIYVKAVDPFPDFPEAEEAVKYFEKKAASGDERAVERALENREGFRPEAGGKVDFTGPGEFGKRLIAFMEMHEAIREEESQENAEPSDPEDIRKEKCKNRNEENEIRDVGRGTNKETPRDGHVKPRVFKVNLPHAPRSV